MVVENVTVKAGDTIDFIVDFRANLNSDMFKWSACEEVFFDSLGRIVGLPPRSGVVPIAASFQKQVNLIL
jgi:hypothetical protein